MQLELFMKNFHLPIHFCEKALLSNLGFLLASMFVGSSALATNVPYEYPGASKLTLGMPLKQVQTTLGEAVTYRRFNRSLMGDHINPDGSTVVVFIDPATNRLVAFGGSIREDDEGSNAVSSFKKDARSFHLRASELEKLTLIFLIHQDDSPMALCNSSDSISILNEKKTSSPFREKNSISQFSTKWAINSAKIFRREIRDRMQNDRMTFGCDPK